MSQIITVDTQQMMACDHGECYVDNDSDNAKKVIINMGVDEGLIAFYWDYDGKEMTLNMPTERLFELLAENEKKE